MPHVVIAGHVIAPGTTTQINIPVIKLYTNTDISMPVHIISGKKPGPVVFVSAAVHGDELIGVEIVRRLIKSRRLRLARGVLVLVSMVNVYGVLNQSRYMPDRRDLNRSFPGSPQGSLAGRVADQFLNEVVRHCDFGIDLHTGAIHRSNLPQIRADLSDPETMAMAQAFGVPVLLNSTLRDGSLRQAAVECGTRILLYEAGEALRFDELSIRAGTKGILNILSYLGMIKAPAPIQQHNPFVAYSSAWLRADSSGIVSTLKKLGDLVAPGTILAEIGDPFGNVISELGTDRAGIIIGKQNIPLVQEGDAMFHIAYFGKSGGAVAENIGIFQDSFLPAADGDAADHW